MFIFVLSAGFGITAEDFIVKAENEEQAHALLKARMGDRFSDDEIEVRSSHDVVTPEIVHSCSVLGG